MSIEFSKLPGVSKRPRVTLLPYPFLPRHLTIIDSLAIAAAMMAPAGTAKRSTRPVNLREHLARHGTRPSCAGDWRRRQQLIDVVSRRDVPPGLQAEAAAVVRLCPRLALRLEPSPGRDPGKA